MEARVWYGCIIFNCLLIHYGVAKTFSINKALTEAALQNQNLSEEEGNIVKKLSPLVYKKTFQIKSPLKPKKFSLLRPTFKINKRHRLNTEIADLDILNKKYVPLFESVSQLFDNLVTSASENTILGRTKKLGGIKLNKRRNEFCPCSERESYVAESNKVEEAVAAPSLSFEDKVDISETATEASNTPSTPHFSSIRQNKNIPSLLSRNTSRRGRNYYGFRARNSATHNRSAERHFSRNNRNDKYHSEHERNETSAKNNETNTRDVARHRPIGDGSQGLRSSKNVTKVRNGNSKRSKALQIKGTRSRPRKIYRNFRPGSNEIIKVSETKNTNRNFGRDVEDFQEKDSFNIRRNKKKISTILSKPSGRLRGDLSEIQIDSDAKSIQPKKDGEKSNNYISKNVTGVERVTKRSRTLTTKDQKVGETNERVTILNHINGSTNSKIHHIKDITSNNKTFVKQSVNEKFAKSLHNQSKYTIFKNEGNEIFPNNDKENNTKMISNFSLSENKTGKENKSGNKNVDNNNIDLLRSEDRISDIKKILQADRVEKHDIDKKIQLKKDSTNLRVNHNIEVNKKDNEDSNQITNSVILDSGADRIKHIDLKDNIIMNYKVTESNSMLTTTTITNLDYDDTTERLNLDSSESSKISHSDVITPQETKNYSLLLTQIKLSEDIVHDEKDNGLKINRNIITNNTSNFTKNTEDIIEKSQGMIKEETNETKDRDRLLDNLANATVHRGDKDGTQKLLMIIDGYSIARDKYGEKRLAKKSVHVIT